MLIIVGFVFLIHDSLFLLKKDYFAINMSIFHGKNDGVEVC